MSFYFVAFYRLALLAIIVWLAYRLAYWLVSSRSKREEDLDYKPMPQEAIKQAAKSYGRSTITVVHLYNKLRYFPLSFSSKEKPKGVVGYASFATQNILIAEPLCDQDQLRESILEFTNFTQKQDKDCLLFPIDQQTARIAEELGYGLIQVGQEPVFDLTQYNSQSLDSKVLSAIRQTQKKGIKIEAVHGSEILNSPDHPELAQILVEWLESRRGQEMQLLNEVSPFSAVSDKKYFIARSKERIEAFLSCSPVYGRNGYFIHDLIRRPTSMNGISEALVVGALENFQAEGFTFASLGVAPLAGLEDSEINQRYPILNWILKRVYKKHKTFMRFKSLYQFKKKFKATSEEPAFVAFFPPTLKANHVMALVGMFSPGGFFGDLLFKWNRWKEGNQLPRPLLNLISADVATLPRAFPFSFSEFASRMPFTFAMFGLNIYTFFNTVSWFGVLPEEALKQYGFTYNDFFSHKWFVLVTSNFVHFNYSHLLISMAGLLITCGTLEFIGGSVLAGAAFLISMNADVPTGLFFLPVIKMISYTAWDSMMNHMAVGASLGTMGALGALLQFLRHKRILLLVTCASILAWFSVHGHFFGIHHNLAIMIGYIVGGIYLNRKGSRKAFQRFQISPALMNASKKIDLAR